ncbi:protein MTSS 1 isoform X2 [Chanos chanos]|uniref:Protein MTSS 1 isoform X2 n=1 Tax=Chanos chanos TaxID=29144 RepID=A0A6J2VV03_CHACN|nr:protein MTSS 2-like isoform X2 [Chanos chanos]
MEPWKNRDIVGLVTSPVYLESKDTLSPLFLDIGRGKMDAGIEKECSALGGLFQIIMNDMKASYPAWEDFVSKGTKLQSQLRTTIIVTSSFLDAFQKVADIATGTRGATKEIGSALTRMCMRHRSIESKLKLFTTALMDNLIGPLELKIEEWKKVASQLDKDHAKEYKKARADIKKKSSDTIKLQKKVKKGKDEVRVQLDSALQDVNTRYAVLEETEKRAVCRALVEERGRFCSFVSMLKPVLDEEISMLGEVTHLQTILEDLGNLTAEPNKLPPASEQVILDLKGSDYTYAYQTPPASPSNSLSRKSSISSNYTSVRHVPSLDSISSAVDGLHLRVPETGQEQSGANSQTASGTENGTAKPPPYSAYNQHGERTRTLSTSSSKPQSAREQLALTLGGGLNSEAPRTSRDSLHCSSGYSTQTTTPSCSEDTIPSHHDYDYISLHGGDEVDSHPDFDKSSTIPRNSDLSLNYRKMFQTKRPASTVSLLADPEPLAHQQHTATIRRKPSSKPNFRRGTISGGVPIPISTPQVPLKPSTSTAGIPAELGTGNGGSDEILCPPPTALGGRVVSDLAHAKHNLCTSTQSLSAVSPSYFALFPGQQALGSTDQLYQMSKQQQYALHQHQQRQFQQQCLQAQQQQQQQQLQQQQQQQLHQQQYQQQHQQQLHQHQLQQQQIQLHQQLRQEHRPPLQQPGQMLHSANASVASGQCHPAQRPPQTQPDVLGPPGNHSEGGDMLTMIRRGIKLRRTITNDRSAPLITPNHLN